VGKGVLVVGLIGLAGCWGWGWKRSTGYRSWVWVGKGGLVVGLMGLAGCWGWGWKRKKENKIIKKRLKNNILRK
jgi:hypothetical protein